MINRVFLLNDNETPGAYKGAPPLYVSEAETWGDTVDEALLNLREETGIRVGRFWVVGDDLWITAKR